MRFFIFLEFDTYEVRGMRHRYRRLYKRKASNEREMILRDEFPQLRRARRTAVPRAYTLIRIMYGSREFFISSIMFFRQTEVKFSSLRRFRRPTRSKREAACFFLSFAFPFLYSPSIEFCSTSIHILLRAEPLQRRANPLRRPSRLHR